MCDDININYYISNDVFSYQIFVLGKYNILDVKDTDYASVLLGKIDKEIVMLGSRITDDLKFKIEHSFKTSGCLPCQKAREEREKNERENK